MTGQAREEKQESRTSTPEPTTVLAPGAVLRLDAVVLRVFGRQAQIQVAGELLTVEQKRLKESAS